MLPKGMGNQVQLDNVKRLLETSPQVTQSEREEWLSLLPFMNDKQLQELVEILETPVSVPVASTPMPSAIRSTTPAQTGSNSVSEVLKRSLPPKPNIAPKAGALVTDAPSVVLVAKENKKEPQEPASMPKKLELTRSPAAKTIPGDASDIASMVSNAAISEEVIPETKSLEDVHRLNVATLRGHGVMSVEADLMSLCKKFGYFSVLFALEDSPLYKTYLNSGNSALQNHESYEQSETKLSSSGKPYLTKPEFEEVNDLLQKLKHV